jgi:hypothetical protein
VLWLASRLTVSAGTPSAGILLAIAAGIPTAMVLSAQALVRVERLYTRMTGAPARPRVAPGWRRSLSDSSAPGPASALEKMMVASVMLAAIALATWFFAFAGSSLPT